MALGVKPGLKLGLRSCLERSILGDEGVEQQRAGCVEGKSEKAVNQVRYGTRGTGALVYGFAQLGARGPDGLAP